jgi:hypothetical protein
MSFKDETTESDKEEECNCLGCTLKRMLEAAENKPKKTAEEWSKENEKKQIPSQVKSLILLMIIKSLMDQK